MKKILSILLAIAVIFTISIPVYAGTIYEDVEALTERVAELEAQVTELTPTDTGWINLTLENGVIPYSTSQVPQYRKIGNKVYLKGAVKNVTGSTVIATLPEGFRPLTGHSFLQNTSYANGASFARWGVETNGNLEIEGISQNATYGADKWLPIHTEFLID